MKTNEILAENIYGKYCVPASSQQRPAAQKILKGHVHEPETIQYIRAHCCGGDVIHAGTYFGDFLPGIAIALATNAMLWAFEPNAENFKCAQKTCALNQLWNVNLFHAALGDTEMNKYLHVRDQHGQSLGGKSMVMQEEIKSQTEVINVVMIDKIIPSDRQVSIIQLDVEGFEKQVLQGARQTIARNKPVLIIEDNQNIISSSWFDENIFSLGYTMMGMVHGNTILRQR